MQDDEPYPNSNEKVKWVSTGWLEDHMDDEMRIIDAQPNIHDYIAEHIPGANYLNEEFLRAPKRGLCGQFMCLKAVEPYYQRVGVKNDTPVLVYTGKGAVKGWGDGLEQTMTAYGLTRYGHDNVYILNGGLDKWKAEGRPLSQDFPKFESGDFKGEVRPYFIRYEEFKEIKDRDDVLVLDARPPAVYEGKGPWKKGGHIPGAVNFPWASLMSPDNTRLLKPDPEIRELVDRIGATKDKTIICSCGTGREATNEFNLFKWYLGYPKVKLHEGAFTEWTSYPENPTVMGKSPR
ncbi:MAG: sulfurtransferase [Methanomassiliicoccus sp.]|nr:sulfurtransferase [Methanomassiliicoccus sp.]